MAERRIPLRKCLGCGEMKEKRQLLRVVHNKEGITSVDLTGKSAGRGAYLCRNVACFDAARKARRFEKTFSGQLPEDIYDTLREQILQVKDED